MLTPLPFTWPLGAVFLVVLIWSYWPQARIMRAARRAQRPTTPRSAIRRTARW